MRLSLFTTLQSGKVTFGLPIFDLQQTKVYEITSLLTSNRLLQVDYLTKPANTKRVPYLFCRCFPVLGSISKNLNNPRKYVMTHKIFVVFLAFSLPLVSAKGQQPSDPSIEKNRNSIRTQGDAAAIAKVQQAIAAMGGEAAWNAV